MENLKTYEIIEANIKASKLHKEISLSNTIENFNGLLIENGDLIVCGAAILNEAALDLIISEHVKEDPLNDEIERYYKRQHDGKVAIINLMAELRLNAQINSLPRIVNKTIENAYWDVAIAINNGWFITALEKCQEVTVGGYITQELHDSITNKISTYIATNY
jgi:hypothetical protein